MRMKIGIGIGEIGGAAADVNGIVAQAKRAEADGFASGWFANIFGFDAIMLAAVTDGLNRLFSNTIMPVKLARDAGLAIVNRVPPLKRLLMQHAMGVLGDRPRLAKGEPL